MSPSAAVVPVPPESSRAASPKPPVRVLYIAGAARSGSTLLEIVLGQLPGFQAVGEVSNIWAQGVLENRLCGCGERFLDCPFWTEVGARAFGGWEAVDARELVRLRKRLRTLPRSLQLFSAVRSRAFRRELASYDEATVRLYRAIQEASPGRIVLDASKDYLQAVVLRRSPQIAEDVIHLVRDARGVVHSKQKPIIWRFTPDRVAYKRKRRRSATEVSVAWVGKNLFCHAFRPSTGRKLFMRYESFVAEPRARVERILGWLGVNVSADSLAFLEAEAFEPRAIHTVAGNPVRMQEGPLRIRLDEEWRRALPRRDRWTADLLTWPLLALYGYVPAAPTPPAGSSPGVTDATDPAAASRAAEPS